MINPEEMDSDQEVERKIRSAFQTHDPDSLFIDRLGKKLADRYKDIQQAAGSEKNNPRSSPWPGRGKLLFSPLAWGAVGIIFLLFLVWGIKTLIPKVEPSLGTKSTPLPSTVPTMVPTQAEGGEGVISLPVLAGTPVPWPEEAITSQNASQLTLLARWGQGMITGIACSPDGKTFAISSATGIHLYDVATFNKIKTIADGSSVSAPAFSPDGTKLAVGIYGSTVKIFDVASGSELQALAGYKNFVTNVAFLPQGDILVTQASEEPIKLWNVASGQEIRTLAGPDEGYFALSPDGTMMATTSYSGSKIIKLWDIASGDELRTLSGHTDSVYTTVFSPDGNKLASASGDKTMKLWDVAKGIELTSILVETGPAAMIYYSPDGTILASVDYSGKLQLWDLSISQEIPTHFEDLRVGYMAFSPDGKTIVASVHSDNTIKLLDVTNGKELRKSDWQSNIVSSVAVSPDGKMIAAGSYFGPITVINAANGQVISTLTGSTGEVLGLVFSPDTSMLASASWDMIKLWDLVNDKEMLTLAGLSNEGYESGVPSVAFSPDGNVLAYGAKGGEVKLWDITGNKLLFTLSRQPDGEYGHEVNGVTFSPDGKILACVYSSYRWSITLWDVASGEELRTWTKPFSPWIAGGVILAFSPDGKYLVSGIGDAVITFWDVTSGSELRTLLYDSPVYRVAYSRGGGIIASATFGQNVDESMITLWDAASGQKLSTLVMWASALAFSPDGNVLVSGSWDDGVIQLWGVAPPDVIPSEIGFTLEEMSNVSVSTPAPQVTPEELSIDKIPIPVLLTGESLQPVSFSPDSNYLLYTNHGPVGEPGLNQANTSLNFLDNLTGETCQGIQETVTFTQTEWGVAPEGINLNERIAWIDDNHLLYISPAGELSTITTCSDSVQYWKDVITDKLLSLGGSSNVGDWRIVIKGEQAFWLFTPATGQAVKVDIPIPPEDQYTSVGWSPWEELLVSSRIDERLDGLWIVLEKINPLDGAASTLFEAKASDELNNVSPKMSGYSWVRKDLILLEYVGTGMGLIDLSSQPPGFTDLFSEVFGNEALTMFDLSGYGTMPHTDVEENIHVIADTGMTPGGQLYLYHPETGLVDQYPLNSTFLIVFPGGEGGIVQSFMQPAPTNDIYKVVFVDRDVASYDLVVKGHLPREGYQLSTNVLPGGEKALFDSPLGISLVNLLNGETTNFWTYENQEQYQDFYSWLAPDGKSMVVLARLKGSASPDSQVMYWLRLEQ